MPGWNLVPGMEGNALNTTERHEPMQGRSNQMAFYAFRRSVVADLPRLHRELGLGPEYRLLVELAARSSPHRPFTWVLRTSQDEWARFWGTPRRTLQRHLSTLRRNGHVVDEFTVIRNMEYPSIRISGDLLNRIFETREWRSRMFLTWVRTGGVRGLLSTWKKLLTTAPRLGSTTPSIPTAL